MLSFPNGVLLSQAIFGPGGVKWEELRAVARSPSDAHYPSRSAAFNLLHQKKGNDEMKYNKDQPQKNPKDWVTSRRPRIGWGLGFAVPTIFVSIAACIFAARNDLQ
jgi:hypothetical protein